MEKASQFCIRIIDFLIQTRRINQQVDIDATDPEITWYSEDAFNAFVDYILSRQPVIVTQHFLSATKYKQGNAISETQMLEIDASNLGMLINTLAEFKDALAAGDRVSILATLCKLEFVAYTTALFRNIPLADAYRIFLSHQTKEKESVEDFLKNLESYLQSWDKAYAEANSQEAGAAPSPTTDTPKQTQPENSNAKRTIN